MTNIPAAEFADANDEEALVDMLSTIAKDYNGVDVSESKSVIGLYSKVRELENIITNLQNELGVFVSSELPVVEEPIKPIVEEIAAEVIEESSVIEETAVVEDVAIVEETSIEEAVTEEEITGETNATE